MPVYISSEGDRMIRQCVLGSTMGLLLFVWRGSAQKPSFEVASVKIDISGKGGGTMGPRPGGFFATNLPLRVFLMYAYAPPNGQLLPAQIIGGPDWIQTDNFDIDARLEGNERVLPIEQTKLMLQSLLEDRFQLKAHRETRDLPVYNLVLTRKGPKLAEDQTPPDPRRAFITFASDGKQQSPLPRGAMRVVTGTTTTITGTAITVPQIITLLQSKSDRIVVDKTGFNGLLDVQLEFSQDLGAATPYAGVPAGVESGPSLFAAIQELGLKLEPGKAPLEVLVIDRVQRPSEN
jgi:uncharacterized protein (TIGR03435 family)